MKLVVSLLQPGEAVPKLLSLDLAKLGLETYADLLACFYCRLSDKFDPAMLDVSAHSPVAPFGVTRGTFRGTFLFHTRNFHRALFPQIPFMTNHT